MCVHIVERGRQGVKIPAQGERVFSSENLCMEKKDRDGSGITNSSWGETLEFASGGGAVKMQRAARNAGIVLFCFFKGVRR